MSQVKCFVFLVWCLPLPAWSWHSGGLGREDGLESNVPVVLSALDSPVQGCSLVQWQPWSIGLVGQGVHVLAGDGDVAVVAWCGVAAATAERQ